MAAALKSSFLSVVDCKVRKILTDPAGGSATYGDWIDVPDILNVNVEFDTDVKERRGDGVIKEKRSTLTGITVTLTTTALALDTLVALQGGTLTASGTGDAETARYTYGQDSRPSYLEIEAQCIDVAPELGDVHLVIHKAQVVTPPEIGFEDDDFKEFEFELEAVALDSTGDYYSIDYNETKVAVGA